MFTPSEDKLYRRGMRSTLPSQHEQASSIAFYATGRSICSSSALSAAKLDWMIRSPPASGRSAPGVSTPSSASSVASCFPSWSPGPFSSAASTSFLRAVPSPGLPSISTTRSVMRVFPAALPSYTQYALHALALRLPLAELFPQRLATGPIPRVALPNGLFDVAALVDVRQLGAGLKLSTPSAPDCCIDSYALVRETPLYK